MSAVAALALGLAAGLLGGVLGLGGGVIMIPGMTFFLGADQHTAQGVSLVVIVATAISGAIAHTRYGNVRHRTALLVALGAVPFGLLGAWLANQTDPAWLQRAFSLLIAGVGLRLLLWK
ncbi:MAG: sulfite exporter TauE/SafE family protein [Chloroflexi bacterium]|nr:sulfite exporter TauE/SafE family protein [Chloroflexota bacterium]